MGGRLQPAAQALLDSLQRCLERARRDAGPGRTRSRSRSRSSTDISRSRSRSPSVPSMPASPRSPTLPLSPQADPTGAAQLAASDWRGSAYRRSPSHSSGARPLGWTALAAGPSAEARRCWTTSAPPSERQRSPLRSRRATPSRIDSPVPTRVLSPSWGHVCGVDALGHTPEHSAGPTEAQSAGKLPEQLGPGWQPQHLPSPGRAGPTRCASPAPTVVLSPAAVRMASGQADGHAPERCAGPTEPESAQELPGRVSPKCPCPPCPGRPSSCAQPDCGQPGSSSLLPRASTPVCWRTAAQLWRACHATAAAPPAQRAFLAILAAEPDGTAGQGAYR